ncbi:hypothetical protein GCM10011411_21950 [Aurantiacibacter arachoides]|nr:hypothetical protein GCM10011411_21950 [Aurantiacibacter arachoides]
MQRLDPQTDAQFILVGSDLGTQNLVSAGFWPGSGLGVFDQIGTASIGERAGIYFAGAHLPSTETGQSGGPSPAERTRYFIAQDTRGTSVVVESGPVQEALSALDRCAEARLATLGLATAQRSGLATPATIRNTDALGHVLGRLYRDYARAGGVLRMRVAVDETGQLIDCATSNDLMPYGLRTAICEALAGEGVLLPGYDAAGQPMADYFFQTIDFRRGSFGPNADGTDPRR